MPIKFTKENTATLITPICTANFIHLAEPVNNELTGKEEYGLVCVFEDDERTVEFTDLVYSTMERIKTLTFGDESANIPNVIKSESKSEVLKDKIYANFNNTKEVKLFDIDKNDINGFEITSGAKVKCAIRFYPYDKLGKRGVTYKLVGVQMIEPGEPQGTIKDLF